MKNAGLRAKPRKPFQPKTTCPDHAAHPSPNLLAKEAPPTAPGQQLVSDITYISTREGWIYLIVMIALFSRFILGWTLEETLEAELVEKALRRALNSGLVAPAAIFHSDRGSPSSARSTRELLERANLRQSMSAKGYCYDNAQEGLLPKVPSPRSKVRFLPMVSHLPPKPLHEPPSLTPSRPSTTAHASTPRSVSQALRIF